jgi:hypothetical protein
MCSTPRSRRVGRARRAILVPTASSQSRGATGSPSIASGALAIPPDAARPPPPDVDRATSPRTMSVPSSSGAERRCRRAIRGQPSSPSTCPLRARIGPRQGHTRTAYASTSSPRRSNMTAMAVPGTRRVQHGSTGGSMSRSSPSAGTGSCSSPGAPARASPRSCCRPERGAERFERSRASAGRQTRIRASPFEIRKLRVERHARILRAPRGEDFERGGHGAMLADPCRGEIRVVLTPLRGDRFVGLVKCPRSVTHAKRLQDSRVRRQRPYPAFRPLCVAFVRAPKTRILLTWYRRRDSNPQTLSDSGF